MNACTEGAPAGAVIEEPGRLLDALRDDAHIVFDLDGTLYDVRDFELPALEAVADWLRERSGRALPGVAARLWSRRERDRHRPGLFDELLESEGLPKAWGPECLRIFHDHDGARLETAPSLRRELQLLRSQNRALALVSNGYPDVQRRKLARLGLADTFDISIICDPTRPERLKPSPWAWSQLSGWRGASMSVFVGDDAVDAAFAAAGGARFVPFRFRKRPHED